MIRLILRKIIRNLGYDGTEKKRYDQLEVSTKAWETFFRHVKEIFVLLEGEKKKLTIVQIGANDTKIHDPFKFIHKKRFLHKILYVEANPDCAEKLKEKNKNFKNIKVLNIAIGNKNQKKPFFLFENEEENGIRLSVLGSLLKEQVITHKKICRIKSNIIKKTVQVKKIKSVLKEEKIKKIDVLLCDIEGYDYEVVKQVSSLGHQKPKLFVYEHNWLPRGVREDGYKRLKANGFSLVCGQYDTMALLKS